VIGDFNGDGVADAALLLKRRRRALLVALHGSREGRFTGHRLQRGRWSEGLFILQQGPGPLVHNSYQANGVAETATRTLAADAICFSAVDTAARVYYFQDGRYQAVELGE
jgi:hypothetical protein